MHSKMWIFCYASKVVVVGGRRGGGCGGGRREVREGGGEREEELKYQNLHSVGVTNGYQHT